VRDHASGRFADLTTARPDTDAAGTVGRAVQKRRDRCAVTCDFRARTEHLGAPRGRTAAVETLLEIAGAQISDLPRPALLRKGQAPLQQLLLAVALQKNTFTRPWVVSYDDVEPIRGMCQHSASLSYGLNYTAQRRYVGSEVILQ
jgi:hypothetical protein